MSTPYTSKCYYTTCTCLIKHIYCNLFTGERLHDVEVIISQNYFTFPTMCGFFGGPGDTGQTIYVFCTEGSRGRYVRLQIIAQIGSENMLTLCEVEVYILGLNVSNVY